MSVVVRTVAGSKKSCVLQASAGLRENRPTRTAITRSLRRSDSTHRKPLSLKNRLPFLAPAPPFNPFYQGRLRPVVFL